jgi:hypothetical protein
MLLPILYTPQLKQKSPWCKTGVGGNAIYVYRCQVQLNTRLNLSRAEKSQESAGVDDFGGFVILCKMF